MIYFVTNLFRAQGHQPTIHRCAPQPRRPPRMRRSFGRPCRCAREAGAHAAGARSRGRARESVSAPAPARLRARRGAPASARCNLRWPSATCEGAASPVFLTACALLPRCRQPRLRAVGLDGHRALDIYVTTGRRDVHTTVTRIRPPARPRALPLGPGGAEPVPVKAVPVSRARSSSRVRPRWRTARPAHHRVRPRRLQPSHQRHAIQGVATPAPPLATGPPHHRLSHDDSPHSPV
jgi:hypothetical protein